VPVYDGKTLKVSWRKGEDLESGRLLRWTEFVPPGRACFTVARLISPADPTPPHRHDFHEIFWIRQGRGIHKINGQTHALGPGTFVLVRDHDEHALSCRDDKGFLITNVAFTKETWSHLTQRYFNGHDLLDAPAEDRHHHLGAAVARQAETFAAQALWGADDILTAERLLLNVLALLRARHLGVNGKHLPAWLNRVLLALDDPKVLKDGVQAMARVAGLSAEHMAREIRRAMNKRPTDLLNEARVQRAAARLLQSHDSVNDIALDCGLDNLSHFYKMFRNAYGCSPVKFRRRGAAIVAG